MSAYLCLFVLFYFVFFFKQKTAYEMRISDWSSDVCSSDLRDAFAADRLDDARQHRYALAEPVQLFLRDAIMSRVARLHIGFLQLLEQDRKSTRLNSSH